MPDNIKELLNTDINAPFMIGMVAQAKAFIIDRAMLSLIIVFFTSALACGGLMYQIKQQGADIKMLVANQKEMMSVINEQNVVIGKLSVEVSNLKDRLYAKIRITK
ncbi:MAG: hypothetical protein KAJ19_21170 [Gammaproteobacteria bacterium]|nr:hypothetical protein [Gammaproteobacteria bacterium]